MNKWIVLAAFVWKLVGGPEYLKGFARRAFLGRQ